MRTSRSLVRAPRLLRSLFADTRTRVSLSSLCLFLGARTLRNCRRRAAGDRHFVRDAEPRRHRAERAAALNLLCDEDEDDAWYTDLFLSSRCCPIETCAVVSLYSQSGERERERERERESVYGGMRGVCVCVRARAYQMRLRLAGEHEASARLERFGLNVLEEVKRNELLVFLSFFWGPMPVMIWLAIRSRAPILFLFV